MKLLKKSRHVAQEELMCFKIISYLELWWLTEQSRTVCTILGHYKEYFFLGADLLSTALVAFLFKEVEPFVLFG